MNATGIIRADTNQFRFELFLISCNYLGNGLNEKEVYLKITTIHEKNKWNWNIFQALGKRLQEIVESLI